MRPFECWILAAAVSGLSGCAMVPPSAVAPRPDAAQTAGPSAPARWHAAVPAASDPAAAGRQTATTGSATGTGSVLWWARFGDPVLADLIAAAQAASPDLSSAGARLAQARSQRVLAQADLWPSVQAQAGFGRGRAEPGQSLATTASASLQTAWEIDLFGARRAASQAAQARLDGAAATRDAVGIAVAAEAALSYVQFRACQAQADLALMDSRSREETARLTALAAASGLRARADAALAQAGAAQGRSLAVQQQAQCERLLKALVALTALQEPALRDRLAAAPGRLPPVAPPAVTVLPAALLQQRPDLSAAAAEVEAAGAELAHRQAQRWPQMAVQGQIGLARAAGVGFTRDGSVWSLGPLSVTIPVFDGGRREAAQRAAAVAYDDAAALYRAALRQAVREVEEALVRVAAARLREADTRQAAQSLDEVLRATQERWAAGLASQFELEDARRSALAARAAWVDLEREQVESAIALYRALGGGWQDGMQQAPA
ncbi:MAG: efflux transporter outer membrane subunit [Rubrivivax sp.]